MLLEGIVICITLMSDSIQFDIDYNNWVSLDKLLYILLISFAYYCVVLSLMFYGFQCDLKGSTIAELSGSDDTYMRKFITEHVCHYSTMTLMIIAVIYVLVTFDHDQ